jgi:hypothetical protein
MAFRKNTRRFDPRYFMDEKMELTEAHGGASGPFPERYGNTHKKYDTEPTDTKETESQAIADMDVGIAREFAQDVVEYVKREIVPEQAPALAGMSMGDLLRLAADIAGDEPMAGEEAPLHLSAPKEDPWKFKKRLGIGGSVHDRLGGPRHREKK